MATATASTSTPTRSGAGIAMWAHLGPSCFSLNYARGPELCSRTTCSVDGGSIGRMQYKRKEIPVAAMRVAATLKEPVSAEPTRERHMQETYTAGLQFCTNVI